MVDDVPSGDRAWFGFFEMVALACTFEGIAALIHGESWVIWLPPLMGAPLFFSAGVKVPWIRGKLVSVNWGLWGKRINQVLYIALILASVAVLTSGYYLYRELSRVLHPAPAHQAVSAIPPTQPEQPVPRKKAQGVATPPFPGRVDWHDKQNWRRYLRVGMSRTDVRRLFGDPDRVTVVYSSEEWDWGYGSGAEVDFDMEGHPDGSLTAWFEPNPW
jgi:hypothetical protein